MASLKELRDRWKTDEGKKRKKDILEYLQSSKETRPRYEDKFTSNFNNLKSRLKGFQFADDILPVDLRGIKLEGEDFSIVFLRNVDFSGANLKRIIFRSARLKHVDFRSAYLTGAILVGARLEGPTFGNYKKEKDVTNLSKADLRYCKIFDALYSGIKYGEYDLRKKEECDKAEGSYRVLRMFFKSQGDYENEDKCYRKEMIAKRKQKKSKLKQFAEWLLLDATCGYGMKPKFVLVWIFALIIIFGFIYSFFGNQFIYSGDLATHFSLGKALYFSTVTFTTLGFGDWHPNPNSLIKFLVALEALLGFIFLTLWIVTLARKIIRE